MKRFLVLFIALAVAVSAMAGETAETKEVKPKKEYKYGKRGYFGNASFTFSHFGTFGEGWLIDKPNYGVDVINGYSFNPHLDLGAGIGAHFQPSSDKTEQYIMMPLYAYLRYNILDRKVSPYIDLKAGWAGVVYREKSGESVGSFNQWGGTTYANIEIGALVRFKEGRSLNVGVGMPWYLIPLLATGISVNVGFTW